MLLSFSIGTLLDEQNKSMDTATHVPIFQNAPIMSQQIAVARGVFAKNPHAFQVECVLIFK